jgi:hypothetical protein
VTGYPNEAQVSRNIEIKARIESADAWVPKIAVLAEEGPIDIAQEIPSSAATPLA